MPGTAATPLHGLSILVVDDNADARVIFTAMLRQAGAAVSTAMSAPTAARRLKHLRPDVILTDLSMPKRDGLWLLQQIRDRDAERKRYTPVIAVTAHEDVYDVGDLRFDAVHVKPVPWGELLQGILIVTERASSAST
jgi:CheY-like chemotaxis protein